MTSNFLRKEQLMTFKKEDGNFKTNNENTRKDIKIRINKKGEKNLSLKDENLTDSENIILYDIHIILPFDKKKLEECLENLKDFKNDLHNKEKNKTGFKGIYSMKNYDNKNPPILFIKNPDNRINDDFEEEEIDYTKKQFFNLKKIKSNVNYQRNFNKQILKLKSFWVNNTANYPFIFKKIESIEEDEIFDLSHKEILLKFKNSEFLNL